MFNDDLLKTATGFVEFYNKHADDGMLEAYYSDKVVSVEALPMEGVGAEAHGIDALKGKHDWWNNAHTVHSTHADGPYLHGDDRFSVVFDIDVTNTESGERSQLKEVAIFTVDGGKIVREEFFYGV